MSRERGREATLLFLRGAPSERIHHWLTPNFHPRQVLKYFWKYDVNLTRIESRPTKNGVFEFFVDFEVRERGGRDAEML